jgi:hypothetical protein
LFAKKAVNLFFMKRLLLFLLGIALFSSSPAQENEFNNPLRFYPTVNLLIGNPVQDFWENYSKQRLWGFNFDLVFNLAQTARWWQPGLQFDIYPFGNKKGTWNGIEVTTSGAFVKANIINRLRFLSESKVSPFVELGYGIHLSSTTTSYEIVDEATFFEEFFLNEEDEYETVNAKEFFDASHNFAVGAGLVFNRVITFQVKYNVTPTLTYVQKDDVKVSGNLIDYETTDSKMQMIVVSIGFTLEKGFF